MNCIGYLSPVGRLTLAEDGIGICRLTFGERGEGAEETRSPLLARAAEELDEYFAGGRRVFDVPLSLHGTPFQLAVWRALQEIPYGETISYGELARRVGNPKASRAVGMANHRNPVSILVPCHRVVGRDGGLVGYGGGLAVKQALLALECGADS